MISTEIYDNKKNSYIGSVTPVLSQVEKVCIIYRLPFAKTVVNVIYH